MDHLVALISVLIGLGSSVLLGRYLEERLGLGRQCAQTAGVMGLAVIGLGCFIVALAVPAVGLRWGSVLVWLSAGAVGILHWDRSGRPRPTVTRTTLVQCGLGVVLLIPAWTMVGFGDELDTWMTVVKEALYYNDVPRATQHTFSPWRDFFGLSSMMQTALLAPAGVFHPAIGRIVTLMMAWAALGELGERLRRRHGATWGSVGAWCLGGLVLVPFCELHASWYVDAPLGAAVALCVLALHDVMEDKEGGSARVRLMLWFCVAVLLKPHAGLLVLYLLPMTLSWLRAQESTRWRRVRKLLAVLVPGLAMWLLWRVWGHLLDDSGVGTWGLERLLSGDGVGLGYAEILGVMVSSAWSPFPNPPLLAHFLAMGTVLLALMPRIRSPFRRWWLVVLAHYVIFLLLFRWVLRPDQVHYWARYALHSHYLVAFLAVDSLVAAARQVSEDGARGEGPVIVLKRVVSVAVMGTLACSGWFLYNLPGERRAVLRSVADVVRLATAPEDHVGVWGTYAAMLRVGHELTGQRQVSVLYSEPYRQALKSYLSPEERQRHWSTMGISHVLYCAPGRNGAATLGVPELPGVCALYRNDSPGLVEIARESTEGVDLSGRGRLRRGLRRAYGWLLGRD